MRSPTSTRSYTIFLYTTPFRSQVDIPFGLGIFSSFDDAHVVAGRGEDQKELIAPEDEARGAWKGEPRAAGTLNDIEARRDQRVAAERKNHRGRVQRAQSHEAGIFDAEVERRKGELQCDVERSEEHTSELQSLRSSSNAVFCLKKTNI